VSSDSPAARSLVRLIHKAGILLEFPPARQ
jgi:hypothetical protein